MYKMRFFITIVSILLVSQALSQQCSLNTTPNSTVTIICGEEVTLSTFATGSSPLLTTDFNSGSAGPGWTSGGGSGFAQPCGPNPTNTPYYWASTAGSTTPQLTTVGFDVPCGGFVSFDMAYSTQGGASPCEGPDLANEGVSFQYSVDGGITWTTIQYWDPNGGNDPMLTSWNNYSIAIPPGAYSSSTMFRWIQLNSSGSAYDNWGLDNVTILPGLCPGAGTAAYDWSNIPGTNDTTTQVVSPMTSTQYIVTFTDGTVSCADTVDIIVQPLIAQASTSSANINCLDCVDLDAVFTNSNAGSIVDDFDPATDATMWSDIQNGTPGNGCTSMSGNALHFAGGGSNRYAATVPVDATTCGLANFCLFIGNSGSGGSPCENADAGEDVVFEYSIDGGTTWTIITTYDESMWDNNNNWQCFTVPLPPASQTTSTMFRWRQLSFGTDLDHWSLDDVSIACSPPPYNYNWTPTISLDTATIKTPHACPVAPTNYNVTITDPSSGCSASSSVFVDVTCSCVFNIFTANNSQCQSGNTFTVSGDISHYLSPAAGTLVVDVTNASGTYSQVFNAPFTDLTIFNYSISGIPADGSPYTVDIYFTNQTTCNSQLTGTSPVTPTFTSISGGGTYCPSDVVNDIVVDVTGTSPWTIDYTINGVPTTATGTSTTVSLGNAAGVYVVTNVSDSSCNVLTNATDSIVIHPFPTVTSFTGGSSYCQGEAINNIEAIVSGTGSWTIDYTIDGVANSTSGSSSPLILGNTPGTYVLNTLSDANCSQAVAGTQTIVINPSPVVDAGLDTILCEGNSIILSANGADNYVWDNGVVNNVPFTPTATTTYTVIGTDINNCSDTDMVTITHEPLPVVSFVADTTILCEGNEVTFYNTTPGTMVDCLWNFGDGSVSQGCDSVTNTYTYGGNYTVQLTTTSNHGCVNSIIYTDYLYVEEVPLAQFVPSPQTLIAFNTDVHFSNSSIAATSYVWNFGDESATSTEDNPTHSFPQSASGSYDVVLTAYSPLGCADSISKEIRVVEEIIYYIPNTFTPDGDEFNQTFQPVFTAGYDPYDFNLFIYNRWGEVIWESHDASVGWDGTFHGKLVESGMYNWKIDFKTKENDARKLITGHVNVIR